MSATAPQSTMAPADPPPFPERRRRIPHVFRTRQWRYPLAITFILALVVGTTLLWRYQPGAIDYKIGEVARQTVKANRTVQYVSTIRTDAARRAALEDPANIVYAQDPSVTDKQAQK